MAAYEHAWGVLCDLTGIAAGTSLLDVGCGEGAFCAVAAALGAEVHGVDGDPERLAIAAEQVPAGDFRAGLIEDLPWDDGAFDVVTGINAFQYALDVGLALAEARRVTRAEGRIGICKWGTPEENEFFGFLGSLGAGGISLDRLPAADPVEEALRRARLDIVATGTVPAPIEIAGDAALEAALAEAGVLAAPTEDAVRARVAEAAAPFRARDGAYRFDNRLRYWIARP
jgi:SAM-dependent methyltransferase